MALKSVSRWTRVFHAVVLALFGIGAVSVPVTAVASDISGTVVYSGSQGPVSAARPIELAVLGLDFQLVDQFRVETSPGDFTVTVPAPGDYHLAALLDVMGDGAPHIGQPFQFYNHRTDPASADILSVPPEGVTGVQVDFNDTSLLSGVGGAVTYTGSDASVTPDHPLVVELYTDAAVTMSSDAQRIEHNGGRFDLITFNAATYYVRAFLDANGNGVADAGEPFTVYNDRGSAPGDPIVAGTDQNALTISFGDEFITQNTPTETPPQTSTPVPTDTPTAGTAACTGDCNGDGAVVVNELIRGVNIALGNAAVSSCPSFDADHDGSVAINELIQAVNRALLGC